MKRDSPIFSLRPGRFCHIWLCKQRLFSKTYR